MQLNCATEIVKHKRFAPAAAEAAEEEAASRSGRNPSGGVQGDAFPGSS